MALVTQGDVKDKGLCDLSFLEHSPVRVELVFAPLTFPGQTGSSAGHLLAPPRWVVAKRRGQLKLRWDSLEKNER